MTKVHVTEKAKDTVFDNCDFENVDLVNEGVRTNVFRSRFNQSVHDVKLWASTWWGQLAIGVAVVVVGGTILFRLGIN